MNNVTLITSFFPEKCTKLLRDAEELINQSRTADSLMDYSSALQLCLEATKLLETILTMENVNQECLVKARIKHGECINKGNRQ